MNLETLQRHVVIALIVSLKKRGYLLRYAQEMAWREDKRRVPNGEQVSNVVSLAMVRKPSMDFSGYWQHHKAS